MRGLGLITLVCSALYSVPPTSFVGAILWGSYFGSVVIAHVQADTVLLIAILLGFWAGILFCGRWLGDRRSPNAAARANWNRVLTKVDLACWK